VGSWIAVLFRGVCAQSQPERDGRRTDARFRRNFSQTVQVAYAGRLLIGFGCAFSWVGVLTVIGQQLPPRHFAAFTGGGQFAGTAGAIAGQAPVGYIVEVSGWRTAMMIIAGLAAALAVAIFFFVRGAQTTATPSRVRSSFLDGLKASARNPQTWIIAVVGMSLTGPVLAFAGLWGPVLAFAGLWGIPWLKAVYGIERADAASMLSLVFVGWLVGAPSIGWLSDRVRARKPFLLLGTLTSTAALVALQ